MNRRGGQPGKNQEIIEKNYRLASSNAAIFRAVIFRGVVSDGLALS